MALTKSEEKELKILTGLEFYDAFKGFLCLPKEEALSELKNNSGFWDLVESLKKRRCNGMKQTAIQRLDAIVLQFTYDEDKLDQQIEDRADYNQVREQMAFIDLYSDSGNEPKSEAEYKKLYLLLSDDDKAILKRIVVSLGGKGGSVIICDNIPKESQR